MTTRTMTLEPVFRRRTKKSAQFKGLRLVIPSDTPASVTSTTPAVLSLAPFRGRRVVIPPSILRKLYALSRRRTHIMTIRSRSTARRRFASA